MHRAAPRGPWAKPLDFNLHINIDGEPCIPFALYVKPEPTGLSSPIFPFGSLPAELQLRIIHFCDNSTLFWLMQTSSVMRSEAKRLFWSYPDAWYLVDSRWLRAGGFTGDKDYDIDFLTCVEQVEIDCSQQLMLQDWIDPQDWRDWIDSGDERREEESLFVEEPVAIFRGMEQLIRDFWRTLQYRCPRATSVVLSGRAPRFAYSMPGLLKKIAVMGPADMTISVSILSGDGRYNCCLERSLWQWIKEDTGGQWMDTCSNWARQSILLPVKIFRGPVGVFDHPLRKYERFYLRKIATRVLLLEARERQHFQEQNKPFGCFKCEAQFKSLGDWTRHAIESTHDDNVGPPENLIPSFDLYNKKLDRLDQEAQEAWGPVYEFWGEDGTEKRQNAKQMILHQIENDPLYAQAEPAEKSNTWEAIQFRMKSYRY